MHVIEIFGYYEREICVGCEGHCGEGAPGESGSALKESGSSPKESGSALKESGCAPGARQRTGALVERFKRLLEALPFEAEAIFYEATEENLERNGDVKKLLSMVDLSPAIVLDGKLLFFGGFSPEGLVQEVSKRLETKV